MISARIKKSFARGARTYARHAALQKEVSHRLVAEFAQLPEPPCRLLDIGCGTGFTSLDAANRWPAAHVCAIDIAMPMARESRNAGINAVAVADAATTTEDTAVSIAVLSNDTDADGDSLTVASASSPARTAACTKRRRRCSRGAWAHSASDAEAR